MLALIFRFLPSSGREGVKNEYLTTPKFSFEEVVGALPQEKLAFTKDSIQAHKKKKRIPMLFSSRTP